MFKVSYVYYWVSFISYLITIFVILYIAFHKRGQIKNNLRNKGWLVIFALIATFGAFTGDYINYGEIVENLKVNPDDLTHLEVIYVRLINWIGGDYILFRLCISLFSFIALYYVFKLTNSLDIRILSLYCMYELTAAVEGRQHCSLYLFFLGVILIWVKRNYIVGLLFLICSVYLHKSGIVAIALFPFLFCKINKKFIILCLIAFPFLVMLENQFLQDYLRSGNDDLAGGSYFVMDEFSRTGIMALINNGRALLEFSLGVIVFCKAYQYRNVREVRWLLRILFGAVYIVAVVYFLDIQQSTPFMRSLRLIKLPVLLILARTMNPVIQKNKLLLGIFGSLWLFKVLYILIIYRYQASFHI